MKKERDKLCFEMRGSNETLLIEARRDGQPCFVLHADGREMDLSVFAHALIELSSWKSRYIDALNEALKEK